ncbi:hypothetical protein OUZ56_021557 [Daphnia magna]|uniref:THAP-type domain-containing protein n=1 Tax=Daphnia magna TaxID=35525 RepID=A0ABR0ATU2_9CRUS|nr:hypothetical protein OUZ56_021557 [Daphnia magna]
MPNRCFVPNCNSGFPGSTTTEKVAFFSAPRDSNLLQRWNHAIPRQDKKLQPSSKVCSLHFEENDIIKGRNFISKDGQAIFYPLKN